ncbi:MAG: hypothetical protein SWK76_01320 [Actinomycetota bacterium]|nr:hypothetical protein [Actinomycetota bacterium]
MDPSGQEVGYGESAAIDIIPDAGYRTAFIVDNGSTVAVADPYVIDGVTEDHQVVVAFEAIEEPGHVEPEQEPGGTLWYLAEGCTTSDYDTWVLVQNPSDTPAQMTLTFMNDEGEKPGPRMTLEPNSRYSWNVGEFVQSYNVSTRVESDKPVVAGRAMYWNDRKGGHDSIGYVSGADL